MKNGRSATRKAAAVLLGMFVVAIVATAAKADAVVAYPTDGTVIDHYEFTWVDRPYTMNTCSYENKSSPVEGAIGGAIIGGILGEIFGGGDSGTRNAGAIFGGIVGGDKAHDQGKVKVCKDTTHYRKESISTYSYSTIRFIDRGQEYTVRFVK